MSSIIEASPIPSLSTPTSATEALLRGFLTKPPARSTLSIKERMRYWKEVANNPAQHLKEGHSGPAAEAARRKIAVQSLRKLIERNPPEAEELQRELLQEAQ